MPEKNLVCIGCPMGCNLQVEVRDGEVKSVKGSLCRRGEEYARVEVIAPRRMVTSLMRVPGSAEPLSVRTDKPVPKSKIFPILETIKQTRPRLPVKTGDIIIRNIHGTGADIIATRDLPVGDAPCRNLSGQA